MIDLPDLVADLPEAEQEDEALGSAMCNGCDNTWYGLRIAHCGACHLTFLSPTGFDEHRPATGGCRATEDLRERGMEPDRHGYWRNPMPPEVLSRIREAAWEEDT